MGQLVTDLCHGNIDCPSCSYKSLFASIIFSCPTSSFHFLSIIAHSFYKNIEHAFCLLMLWDILYPICSSYRQLNTPLGKLGTLIDNWNGCPQKKKKSIEDLIPQVFNHQKLQGISTHWSDKLSEKNIDWQIGFLSINHYAVHLKFEGKVTMWFSYF